MDMAHWRKLFDGKYIGAWDLMTDDGEPLDKTVTIERVWKDTVVSADGKARKGLIKFKESDRPLIGNPTIMTSIEKMYGPDYLKWSGSRVTLYAATTNSPRGEVPCVRVRPKIPDAKKANGSIANAAPSGDERQPGQDG
jgi:hypothetical protein